jgi:hypothetical protein
MSIISDIPHITHDNSEEIKQGQKSLGHRLSKLGRAFWQYTEDTNRTDTKPFEGIL